MLPLPTLSVSRSIDAHNIDFGIVADWIEASLHFAPSEEISLADVTDVLLADYVYDDEQFCQEGVEGVWLELQYRATRMGAGAAFNFEPRRVTPVCDSWGQKPAAAFCLLLSLSRVYQGWAKSLGPDYTVQGELFERIAEESVRTLLTDWRILRTGWSREDPKPLRDVVSDVSDHLGLISQSIEPWANENANEAGLDIVLHRDLGDQATAAPVLLMQCSSGKNWKTKRKAPDLDVWNKLITFVNTPARALAIPFALTRNQMKETGNIVDGPVLDRCRILGAGDGWLSDDLAEQLVDWLNGKLGLLESL